MKCITVRCWQALILPLSLLVRQLLCIEQFAMGAWAMVLWRRRCLSETLMLLARWMAVATRLSMRLRLIL